MVSFFLGCYFTCLVIFSFVCNPIMYCVLLVLSSFSAGGVLFCVSGFSWYVLLFFLVYVGGVYVLFIFVSVHLPNTSNVSGGGGAALVFSFLFFLCFFSSFFFATPVKIEMSHYLCSWSEGYSYLLLCLFLMLSFGVVSLVIGGGDSYNR